MPSHPLLPHTLPSSSAVSRLLCQCCFPGASSLRPHCVRFSWLHWRRPVWFFLSPPVPSALFLSFGVSVGCLRFLLASLAGPFCALVTRGSPGFLFFSPFDFVSVVHHCSSLGCPVVLPLVSRRLSAFVSQPTVIQHLATLVWRIVAASSIFVCASSFPFLSCLNALSFSAYYFLTLPHIIPSHPPLPLFFSWALRWLLPLCRTWYHVHLLPCGQFLFCFHSFESFPPLQPLSFLLIFILPLMAAVLSRFALRLFSLSPAVLGAPASFLLAAPFSCVYLAVLLRPLFSRLRFALRCHCCACQLPLLVAYLLYPLVRGAVPCATCFLPPFSLSPALSMTGLLCLGVSSLLRIPFIRCAFLRRGLVFHWSCRLLYLAPFPAFFSLPIGFPLAALTGPFGALTPSGLSCATCGYCFSFRSYSSRLGILPVLG